MSETLYPISIEVNGVQRAAEVRARLPLVDWLREELRLTGTHVGCEHGICGACSVLLDGEPVRACLMFAVQADGHRATTVDGRAPPPGTCGAEGVGCGRTFSASSTGCSAATARRAC